MQTLITTNRFSIFSNSLVVALLMGAASSFAGDVTVTWQPNSGPSLIGYNGELADTLSSDCTYTISPFSQSYGPSGGTGSVSVTAEADCNWSVVSNAAWLTITSATTGNGDGPVTYSVQENTTGTSRIGTVTIAGLTFVVTQSTITCSYYVSPTSQSFTYSANNGSVSVTATSACSWIAVSTASWITITSISSTNGNGTVNYSVQQNTGSSSRTGTLSIAGQTVSVTQSGSTCKFTVSPISISLGASADIFTVSVSAPSGCNWTAASNAAWITISSGSNGSGNGTAYFSVAANTTKNTRIGTVTVAGQTVAVTQAGLGCSYSVSPTSASFSDRAGSGTISVTTTGSCSWLASSNATWISITAAKLGSANGEVSYSVQANPSTSSRTGTMTVAGQTFTVTQSGYGCTFTLSPTSKSFSDSAGSGTVSITGPGTCTWTASSNVSWITITSAKTGSGSGALSYSVGANKANKPRTGTILIAGRTFTVNQASKSQVYFSQIANGEDWVSSFVLTNPSSTETSTGTIFLLDDQGRPLSASVNDQPAASTIAFSIEPLGSATFSTDGTGDLVSGSARIDADVPVSGVVKYSHAAFGTAGVGDSSPLRSLMTAVVRDKDKHLNTGLALSNTLSRDVELKLSMRGLDGLEVSGGSATETLPAGGHMAKFIDQLFPNADTENFKGTLFVSATGPEESIAATAIQIGSSVGEFTTMPVVPVDPSPMTTELYFAQFASGGDWTTSLFLTNPTSSANTGELTFYDDEGNRVAVSINGQLSVSVPSSIQSEGGAFISTDGAGALISGSARVISDNAIGGVLRFSLPALGIAGVGASEPVEGFIAPVERNASGDWSTGVAIASIGSPVKLQLTLRNERGQPVPGGEVTLELRANGHVSRFLEQLFPEAETGDFRGTLTAVSAGGKVIGTAIQIGSRPGQFTTLPVFELR